MAFCMLDINAPNLRSLSTGSWLFSMILTIALPRITPSPASAACLACSGPDIPKPMKTGSDTDFLISLTFHLVQLQ